MEILKYESNDDAELLEYYAAKIYCNKLYHWKGVEKWWIKEGLEIKQDNNYLFMSCLKSRCSDNFETIELANLVRLNVCNIEVLEDLISVRMKYVREWSLKLS